jgi:Arc/MetJ family transcription regulator
MRTNIEIDDELMRKAMAATGTTTKKAAVEASLRILIEVKARESASDEAFRQQSEARLAAIREGRFEEWWAELQKTGTRVEEPAHANQY